MIDIWDAKYRAEQHNAHTMDIYSPSGRHIVSAHFDGFESLHCFVLDAIDAGWFERGETCHVGNDTLFIWDTNT